MGPDQPTLAGYASVLVILDLLALVVVLTTLLPFLRKGYWWVRVWDFPRTQIAVLGIGTLAGLILAKPTSGPAWLLLLALAASTGYQVYRIFRFTPLAPTQVLPGTNPDPARKLRILISNVLLQNRDADRLCRLIERTAPDVVLAMETDTFWAEQLARFDEDFPFRIKRPQDNAYGLILLSRLELRDAEVRYLFDDDVPSVRAQIVLRCGDEVRFYALHPRPPHAFQATFDRDAEILVVGREIHDSPQPAIVAGDLNDVAWSYSTRLFQRMSGLMDPRLGRGLYNTFNARNPLVRWPLDHIFFDAEFRLVHLERLPDIGSDHFPILAEISFEPEGADEHEPRSPMPGDRAEVRRLIREGREAA